ncbi:hypothetical protein [Amycolatopsis sp. CA-230715]|uniref:hypothetical protein n=1 Tax=Amycolatopsis sp. CA-230715 TaxID=2745196 RepID=UPI001C02C4CF|nr:hypothetical protein [Amycolatopsis sp. CA-230715]QWF78816.1 hypothetical protein HUW46_02214 [Amycolatopsis sp. CA-230715]
MFKVLLSVHIFAVILVVGPIAVAASLFPRYAKQLAAEEGEVATRSTGVATLLHRICRGYAVVGIAVPVFGIGAGAHLGVLGDYWLIASMILTAAAAALLVLAILPAQRRAMTSGSVSKLAMTTGIFNLLWAIVVVLMIVRPGSTTGMHG